ncbi:hypothetical protein [Streptomyces mirabilis]|uniref:hypothetical protein n=1 Tax=Streptomyces mirabilis TaxID=68239 RepID=UPI0036B9C49E
MRDAVIADAVRMPIAKGTVSGAYADIHPVDLHAHARYSNQLMGEERQDFAGPCVAARYLGGLIQQGVGGELIAGKWGFSCARLDEFGLTGQRRAAEAGASEVLVDDTRRPLLTVIAAPVSVPAVAR